MKTLRQIRAATILSLSLTVSVFAGQIETPGAPAVATGGTTTTIAGHIDTPGAPATGSTTTTIVLTILSLFR